MLSAQQCRWQAFVEDVWVRGLNLFPSTKLKGAPEAQACLPILVTVRRIKIRVAKVYACSCERYLGSKHI